VVIEDGRMAKHVDDVNDDPISKLMARSNRAAASVVAGCHRIRVMQPVR
jgi:hypothetical protein